MKLWEKLQNPFALVAQGFVVGGVLFWTTDRPRPRRCSRSAVLIAHRLKAAAAAL